MAYPNFYQQAPMQQPQFFQPQQNQPQMNGFLSVPNEEVARNYPVAPGNSISFKNENAPYVYTKTMGFSQFDQPIFKRYKLIEEEDVASQTTEPTTDYTKRFDDLNAKIDALEKEIALLKEGV